MTTGGWIVMVLAVGGMTILLGWCISRVLSTPGTAERLHGTADIEPPDTEQD